MCRDEDLKAMALFLSDMFTTGKGRNLLIFGKPGTGKTVCVRYLLSEIRRHAAVSMMARLAKQTEEALVNKVEAESFRNISSVISRSIWQISGAMPLDKVVTITRTGYTARMISRFKLKQPIIAVASNRFVKRQLDLMYGVYSILFNYEVAEDRILAVAQMLYSKNLLSEEDTVLFTAGFRTAQKHSSNIIEIHTVRELLEFGQKNVPTRL